MYIKNSKTRFKVSSGRKDVLIEGFRPGRTSALFDLFASRDPQMATPVDFHLNVRLANGRLSCGI